MWEIREYRAGVRALTLTAHDFDGRLAGTAKLSFTNDGRADLWLFRVERWALGCGAELLEAALDECRQEALELMRCDRQVFRSYGQQAHIHDLVGDRCVGIHLKAQRFPSQVA